MKRYLAREIITDGGLRWELAVLTVNDDGSWTVQPFEGETHSTVFVEGTIVIRTGKDSLPAHPANVGLTIVLSPDYQQ